MAGLQKALCLTAGGKAYSITTQYHKRQLQVLVDGQVAQAHSVKSSAWGIFQDFDFPIGDETYTLAIRGTKAGIAKNGRYLDSDKPLMPPGKLPIWFWLFAVLMAPLFLGGAIGAGLCAGGLVFLISQCRSDEPTANKLFSCVLTAAGTWGIYLALSYFISTL